MLKLVALTMLGIGAILGEMAYLKVDVTGEAAPLIHLIPSAAKAHKDEAPSPSGSLYTRWGRTVCPCGAELVYSGVIGGGHSGHTGGGSEYLCMMTKPEYGPDRVNWVSLMYGAEFKVTDGFFDKANLHTDDFDHKNGLCAVCKTTRNVQLMIPGAKTCIEGWTYEYHGYLMSSRHVDVGQRNYICVDIAPEAYEGGQDNKGGATMWPVRSVCGSLSCTDYEYKEMTCVVCSQ